MSWDVDLVALGAQPGQCGERGCHSQAMHSLATAHTGMGYWYSGRSVCACMGIHIFVHLSIYICVYMYLM